MTDKTLNEHHWMSEWLESFLETNVDALAQRDVIVLDRIREHLAETPNRPIRSGDPLDCPGCGYDPMAPHNGKGDCATNRPDGGLS